MESVDLESFFEAYLWRVLLAEVEDCFIIGGKCGNLAQLVLWCLTGQTAIG